MGLHATRLPRQHGRLAKGNLMTDIHPRRFLNLEGIKNLRELGGYSSSSGTIRWNKLLRSGGLDQVPSESQQALLEYGVTHIIDIRDEWEQQTYRNAFTDFVAVHYQNVPLIGDNHLEDDAAQHIMKKGTLAEVNFLMLERCKPQIKCILDTVIDATRQGCAIVHCYAGKDRTGLISALVLGALEIPDEVIITDYHLSHLRWAAFKQEWQANNKGELDIQQIEKDASAKPETMSHTLAYIRDHYHHVHNYLADVGISAEQVLSLRQNLINMNI
jgi:protein-tyrosine phosphatase